MPDRLKDQQHKPQLDAEVHLTTIDGTGPVLPLSAGVVRYFMGRGISEDTLHLAGVVSKPGKAGDLIGFPYQMNGQVYAHKVRGLSEKKFWQQGSCATWWLDWLAQPDEDLVLVEGEIDALSVLEVGSRSVLSVPCGAVAKVRDGKIDPSEDGKLKFVWTGKRLYEEAKRVIIAMDADEPGIATAEEIARRIGKARCWKITWPTGCKDANDVLVKLGPDALRDILANPEPWPVAGVYHASEFIPGVMAMYKNGVGHGESTGFSNLDNLYTVVRGQLTVITGSPGSGKTTWLNNVMVNLAKTKDWKFAVYSTELDPELHMISLASMYLEEPFFLGPTPRMSEADLDRAISWIADHFIFVSGDDNPSYLDIIDRFQVAVMRMGVQAVSVDPTGYVKRPDTGLADHEAIGVMLESFRNFGRSHDCAVFCVAHPTKMRTREDGSVPIPRGFDISGSAAWYSRADAGLTVHRPPENRNTTLIVSWKARFAHSGSEGQAELFYDPVTQRFDEVEFTRSPTMVYSMSSDPWDFGSEREALEKAGVKET